MLYQYHYIILVFILLFVQCSVVCHNKIKLANYTQDKTRQRGVTDAGTTVPLSPHLQCRYSDDNIHFIQLKILIDLRFRLGSLSNQT